MSMHPYLFFTNTTRDAMTRYQEILGGHLDILGMDDMPAGDAAEMPFEAPEGFVMHAALKFGDGDLLLASDDPTGDGKGVTTPATVGPDLHAVDELCRLARAAQRLGCTVHRHGETPELPGSL